MELAFQINSEGRVGLVLREARPSPLWECGLKCVRWRRVLSKVDVLRVVVRSIGSCAGDRLGAVGECWGRNKEV